MKLSKLFLVLFVFFFAASCTMGKVQIIDAQNARNISNDLLIKIKAGQYKEVEDYFDYLVKKKPVLKSGMRVLEEVYTDLSERRNVIDYYNQWCSSGKPHHSAFIVRGMYHTNDAWRDRGTGYAYTISDEGYILFKKKLAMAKKDLETAYYLNPKDPNSAGKMITVLTGLSSDRNTRNDWFEKAIEADSHTLLAYSAKLNYLFPKWGGSEEQAKDFALYCYNSSPKKSIVYIIMISYLIETANHSFDSKGFLTSAHVQKIIGDIFKKWLLDYPESSYAYARKADVYFDTDRAMSFQCLNKAIELDSENVYALNMRANHYLDMETSIRLNRRKAEADCMRTIEVNPEYEEAYNKLSVIADNLYDDYDKAIEYLDKAIELDKKNKTYYSNRGNAKLIKQRYEEALKDFEEMVKLDNRNFRAYFHIGECYQDLKEYKKAQEALLIAGELLQYEEQKGDAGSLNKEEAQRWKHMIKNLLLRGIASITPEQAKELVEKEDSIFLDNVKEISPEVAEYFGKFKERLYLDGLTSMTSEVALYLSKHNGILSLKGLTSITPAVAKHLSEHKEEVDLSGLTSITPEVAQHLVKRKGNHDYSGLASITPAVAIQLCKADGSLKLDGMQSITPEVAKHLGQSKHMVQLNGISSLSPESAEELSKIGDWLILDGIKEITDEIAVKLGKHKLSLFLNGLESISVEAAKHLKNVNGCLSLNGLKSITPEAAEQLSGHNGQLVLSGLSSITPQIAERLSKHKGYLDLSGIKNLDSEVAKNLSAHEGPLDLSGVEYITAETCTMLKKYQHIQLPGDIDDIIEEQVAKDAAK